MSIKMDTDAVSRAATQIDTFNQQIRDNISDVDAAVSALQTSWQGRTADVFLDQYNAIKRAYCEERFMAVNRFVTFLNHSVRDGYDTSEKIITSAASAFQ